MKHKRKARSGITITEAIVASALMMTAMVPILKAITTSHIATTIVDHKSCSLMLAKAKIEDIRAKAIYNYGLSYSTDSSALSGAYFCRVADSTVSANLRHISVSVGYDDNGNGAINDNEIRVTLETLIAKRW